MKLNDQNFYFSVNFENVKELTKWMSNGMGNFEIITKCSGLHFSQNFEPTLIFEDEIRALEAFRDTKTSKFGLLARRRCHNGLKT